MRIGRVQTGIKCEFLTDENFCSTYGNRPEWCLTAKQMESMGLLPDNCAYKNRR